MCFYLIFCFALSALLHFLNMGYGIFVLRPLCPSLGPFYSNLVLFSWLVPSLTLALTVGSPSVDRRDWKVIYWFTAMHKKAVVRILDYRLS